MTTWYDAQEQIVASANSAMAEIADAGYDPDMREKMRKVWEPVAAALQESIPEDFEQKWPELSALADDAGADFIGVTSDTRRVVAWGKSRPDHREFVIL